jgi:hypothetical protein
MLDIFHDMRTKGMEFSFFFLDVKQFIGDWTQKMQSEMSCHEVIQESKVISAFLNSALAGG